MAFFQDTFTGTSNAEIDARSPDLGTGWTCNAGGHRISNANRCRHGSGGWDYSYTNPEPSGSEYTVEADFHIFSFGAATLYGGLFVRGQTDTATRRAILLKLESDGSDLDIKIVYTNPGTASALGSTTVNGGTFATGQGYHARVVVTDGPAANDSVIDGYITRDSDGQYLKPDGSWQAGQIACVTGTYDDSVWQALGATFQAPSPGKVGIETRFSASDSAGLHFDNFEASDAGASSFSADPTSIFANATGELVTLTGTGTSWTGTPFTIDSGPSGTTIASQNVISGTSAEVEFDTGSATGTIVLSDGTTTVEIEVIAGTITVVSPVPFQSFQRSGQDSRGIGGTAGIVISGTYTGSPAAIEASWDGGSYATIDAAPAAGAFSGTLASQPPGSGTLTVRFTDATTVSDTVANVSVGEVFLGFGQSNMTGGSNSFYEYTSGTGLVLAGYDDTTGWYTGNDLGATWQFAGEYLMSALKCPVAFLIHAVGGTSITSWEPGDPNYEDAIALVAAAGTEGVRCALWWLGESDMISGMTGATYVTAMESIAAEVNTDLGVPFMPTLIQNLDTATASQANQDAINDAIEATWDTSPNVVRGPDLSHIPCMPEDTVHLSSAAKRKESGVLWSRAILEEFFMPAGGVSQTVIVPTYRVVR